MRLGNMAMPMTWAGMWNHDLIHKLENSSFDIQNLHHAILHSMEIQSKLDPSFVNSK